MVSYLFSENEITNYGQSPATISGVTTIDAANCTLKGLILSGITLNKSDITINRCYIKTSNYSYSIAFESNISNIVIHQNIITNSISGGSSMVGTNCVVTNNIIYSGINYLKNSIIEYNTIITTSKGYLYYLYGNTIRNNMFPSPIFHDMNMLMADNAISNNYEDTFTEYLEGPEYASGKTKFESGCKLKSDSPLLTMSTTGGEIGAFGGTDPYVLSGIPNIPIIKSISASSNANKSDGLSVSIVITTQP